MLTIAAPFCVCVCSPGVSHRGQQQRGQDELVGEDALAVGDVLALRLDARRAALLPEPRVRALKRPQITYDTYMYSRYY